MAYNKNLYSSNVSALDAGIIYDQNQQLMQDEINAGIRDGDIIVGQADNLASEQNQFSTGEFIERTTGGDASLTDGDGYLVLIRGSKLHEGYYAQSVDMELTHASGSEITAVIDDDTFLSQMVSDSGTFTTVYNGSSWSYNPGTYGITVTGTPLANDTITVTYQKEIRGTITMSNPQTFVSTGWNLYNHTLGYARVLKYHETYGFGITGTYTALQFSSTISGTKTSVTVTDGKFSITEDGYIWVTGGNNTDTAIWMTWSDWQSEPNGGTWQAYTEDTVDFSSVMTSYFPYGLMAVEGYRDEIDFSLKKATVNVGRLIYNSTNLELARSYRTAVDYDENYIYYGLPEPVVNEISISNDYMAYDHGIEYFTDTEVLVYTQTLYGINLKNKLERDVVTISQQTLTENQKTQVQKNIGIYDKLNKYMVIIGEATFDEEAVDPQTSQTTQYYDFSPESGSSDTINLVDGDVVLIKFPQAHPFLTTNNNRIWILTNSGYTSYLVSSGDVVADGAYQTHFAFKFNGTFLIPFDINGAQEHYNELKTSLNNLCLQSAVVTVSGNGTTSHTLTGLTGDHVIDNWGMFTDSACTTPIPENAPTADITITPGANSWTLLIENFSSTFYMKPTFILPQN